MVLSKFRVAFAICLLSGSVALAQIPGLLKLASKPVAKVENTAALSKWPEAKDDEKNTAVINELIAKAGLTNGLQVSVSNGIVVIEGQIKDQAKLDWLVAAAERLPLIVGVVNNADVVSGVGSDLSPVRAELNAWYGRLNNVLWRLLVGIVAVAIFYFISGFLHRLSYKLWGYRIKNPFLLSTVAKFSLMPVYIFMFYMLLLMVGLQNLATTIIGGTGVLGLVLGLAFKGIVENFLSGILLATRSPFTKGDLIEVEDIRGVVQNLNMRGTTVMDNDGTLILIPNTTVVQSIIQNYSANPQTRTSFTISISVDDSVTQAQKLILDVMAKIDRVLTQPPPLVLVDSIEDSQVILKIYFWFDLREASLVGSRSRVMSACKDALYSAGFNLKSNSFISLIGENSAKATSRPETVINQSESQNKIEQTHNQMMKGVLPEESLKKMAQQASLPGNSQSPDLLKPSKGN